MFTDEIEVMLQTGKTPSLCALLPGQRLTHQEKGILMPKDPSLVTFVNRWLTRQIAAGRIEALKKQYLGAEASPP
jgi:ABC-type amino acid transport substrate-binding protein